ncbi:hypothetical protein BaRGS_00002592, partial [Batillaria attramentaria]
MLAPEFRTVGLINRVDHEDINSLKMAVCLAWHFPRAVLEIARAWLTAATGIVTKIRACTPFCLLRLHLISLPPGSASAVATKQLRLFSSALLLDGGESVARVGKEASLRDRLRLVKN